MRVEVNQEPDEVVERMRVENSFNSKTAEARVGTVDKHVSWHKRTLAPPQQGPMSLGVVQTFTSPLDKWLQGSFAESLSGGGTDGGSSSRTVVGTRTQDGGI